LGESSKDRNHNGKFDEGEPGLGRVRVVTSSGQSATTDRDGQYSLHSLAPGSVVAAVDPATVPPGYGLPTGERRSGGSGQLLVTPLGAAVCSDRISDWSEQGRLHQQQNLC
jgi:hypothetical protein